MERTVPASHAVAWPGTSRLLPWCLAGISVMLWLAPFDAMQLPISLPVDAKLDRFALGLTLALWLLVVVSGSTGRPRPRPSVVGAALLVWLGAITVSIIVNLPQLTQAGELSGAVKAASLALSFAALFLIVATTLRADEVGPLLTLNLALACITAIGVVVQFRTGTNYFFKVAGAIPGLQVGSPPVSTQPGARADITGPTGHGLAVGTMMGMVVPLAMGRLLVARRWSQRALYAVAVALLLIGCVSTQRRTALIVPVICLVVLALYRPRRIVRLLPLGVVLVVVMQLAAPGAISGLRYQFSNTGTDASSQGRSSDYPAVQPDVMSHLLFGRGYGAYDASKYRFLDNQVLGSLITSGLLGLLAYLALVLAVFFVGHRLARESGTRGIMGAAVASASVGYLICNVLFDTLAFRPVTYVLMLLAGCAVALHAGDEGQRFSAPARR